MRPNDIYTVDDLVDNLRECAKDWLYCGGSEALEEQFELASEAIRERVTDFEAKVIALQKELDTLKVELAQYEWQSGEPKAEGEYLVLAKNSEGDRLYLTSDYTFTPMGNLFDAELYDLDVLAWSEIRPYRGNDEIRQ